MHYEEILTYFSKSIIGKNNEDEILWDLASNCISKLNFEDCVIYSIDLQQKKLIQKAAFGPKNPKDKKIYNPVEIILGQGICGVVAQTGLAEIVNDTSKDKRYIQDDLNRLSEITVPIMDDEIIYGVIDCEHSERNFFNQDHLKILSSIASICAVKLKSVRATNKLLEEQNELLYVKEKMLDLRLQVFTAQLNPHFIFNSLNSIQYFLLTSDKNNTLKYFSIFSRCTRYFLSKIEEESAYLYEEISILKMYMELQLLRNDNHFKYEFDNTVDIDDTDILVPSCLILGFFENIIEYVINNQLKNYHVIISILTKDGQVEIKAAYKFDKESKERIPYKPEYRKRILKYKNQIRILNQFKNYNISKTYIFYDKINKNVGAIYLKLPILN